MTDNHTWYKQPRLHDTALERMKEQLRLSGIALEQLLLAYAKGEVADEIEWEDLNLAFEYAKTAMPGRYEKIVEQLQQEENE